MPATTPKVSNAVAEKLIKLGEQIREHRKKMGITVTIVAEAARMSRPTIFRIEKGEPQVTMGAYLNVMEVLKMEFGIIKPAKSAMDDQNIDHKGWIPARIHLADYPQLKQLAWQIHGTDELTLIEALNIYERNWRHMDVNSLEPLERQLVDALHIGLGKSTKDV